MKLLLLHPGAATVSCEECQRYIYDVETWERKTYRAGPRRIERPCLRPVSVPTPCERCPKESPAKAKDHQLSPRNHKALEAYLRLRAAPGFARLDMLAAKNMAVIDEMYREWERRAVGRQVARHVADLLRT